MYTTIRHLAEAGRTFTKIKRTFQEAGHKTSMIITATTLKEAVKR